MKQSEQPSVEESNQQFEATPETTNDIGVEKAIELAKQKYGDSLSYFSNLTFTLNGMKYYVSVSSFDKKQEANILIRVPGDKKEVKGSLRFNYMVPVPDECIEKLVIKDVKDEKYRLLLNKEYKFCIENAERIQKKANKIYKMVKANNKQILTDNSCAFYILEEGCQEYIEKYLRK